MTFATHQVANIAVLTTLAIFGIISPFSSTSSVAITNNLITAGTLILGAAIPDIDNSNSTITRLIRRYINRNFYISDRYADTYNHRRKLTHWPFFWLLWAYISVFVGIYNPTWQPALIGFFSGIFGHLFCDLFNPQGLLLLAPFSKKTFRLAKIPVGTSKELWFAAATLCYTLILSFIQAVIDKGYIFNN